MNLQHSILSMRIFSFLFLFSFFYRWNPAQRSCRMEKPRIFPGGLVSLDEKPCNSSRHLFVRASLFFRPSSFMHAYIIVPAWNFQVSFIFFSLCDVSMPGEDTKGAVAPRGNVFQANTLCKNLPVFCFLLVFSFSFIYALMIFGSSLKNAST